jgi:tyrosyl-DNA phosphodiesterase 2
LNSEGHFVPSRSKRKMADSQLLSVDAARYSLRHKTWRRTSKSAKNVIEPLPSTIKLVTWNVDFSASNAKIRLKAALTHIQNDVLKCKDGERPPPCCILLQEIIRVGRTIAIQLLAPSELTFEFAGSLPHYFRQ